jgi:hypothetical protein
MSAWGAGGDRTVSVVAVRMEEECQQLVETGSQPRSMIGGALMLLY